MTELAWLVVGLILGGCISMITLCCMQYHRTCDYEEEIRRLRDELNKKN